MRQPDGSTYFQKLNHTRPVETEQRPIGVLQDAVIVHDPDDVMGQINRRRGQQRERQDFELAPWQVPREGWTTDSESSLDSRRPTTVWKSGPSHGRFAYTPGPPGAGACEHRHGSASRTGRG